MSRNARTGELQPPSPGRVLALGVVGIIGLLYLKGWTIGLGVVGSIAWSNASSFSFIAVPLFVFMSGILLHSGIGKGLYTAVALLYQALPESKRSGRVEWPGKSGVTFSDALMAVRRWLWREWVFPRVGLAPVVQELPEPVQDLLLCGLAPAA